MEKSTEYPFFFVPYFKMRIVSYNTNRIALAINYKNDSSSPSGSSNALTD
jgi:hypothetical protein